MPKASIPSGPLAYDPRTPWGAMGAVIVTLLINGSGLLVLSGVLSLDKTLRSLGKADGLWRADMGTLLAVAAWQAVTIGLTIAASHLRGGTISDVLALKPPAGGIRTYGFAAVLTVVAQAVIWLLGLWLIPQQSDNQPPSTSLFGEQWWLALLVIGLGSPLAEELLFRGFLLSALARTRLGFWPAAVIATAWWTFLHSGYSVAGFLSVFVMGLLYSWQLQRTGSLRVPLVSHAIYNILIVVLFGRLNIG